jgi:hypothetical protein
MSNVNHCCDLEGEKLQVERSPAETHKATHLRFQADVRPCFEVSSHSRKDFFRERRVLRYVELEKK